MYGKQTLSGFSPPSLTCKGGSFEPLEPPLLRAWKFSNIRHIWKRSCALGCVHIIPRGYFSWRHEKLFGIACEHLHVSNMRLYTLEIGAAQPLFVTEITPPKQFLCVNRRLIRYGFLGGAQAIRYSVNIALTFTQFPDNSKFQAVLSIDEFEMNESEMMPSDSNTCMFVF